MCFPVLCPDSLVTLVTWRWRESTAVDSELRDSGDGDVLYIAWVALATLDMRTKNSYSRMAVNHYYTVSLLFVTDYQNLHCCAAAALTGHTINCPTPKTISIPPYLVRRLPKSKSDSSPRGLRLLVHPTYASTIRTRSLSRHGGSLVQYIDIWFFPST